MRLTFNMNTITIEEICSQENIQKITEQCIKANSKDNTKQKQHTRSNPQVTQTDIAAIISGVLTALIPLIQKIITDTLERQIPQVQPSITTQPEITDTIREMKIEHDNSLQYQRRDNIRIHGIKQEEGEKEDDVEEIVIRVAGMCGADITKDMISTAHRVPRKPGNRAKGPLPIIVKFKGRKHKDEIYRKKKILHSTEGAENIYITEDLTQLRFKMLMAAKNCVGRSGATTHNGKIMIWRTGQDKPTVINHPKDLLKLELEPDYSALGLE